jgi:hypothetical protein
MEALSKTTAKLSGFQKPGIPLDEWDEYQTDIDDTRAVANNERNKSLSVTDFARTLYVSTHSEDPRRRYGIHWESIQ